MRARCYSGLHSLQVSYCIVLRLAIVLSFFVYDINNCDRSCIWVNTLGAEWLVLDSIGCFG